MSTITNADFVKVIEGIAPGKTVEVVFGLNTTYWELITLWQLYAEGLISLTKDEIKRLTALFDSYLIAMDDAKTLKDLSFHRKQENRTFTFKSTNSWQKDRLLKIEPTFDSVQILAA